MIIIIIIIMVTIIKKELEKYKKEIAGNIKIHVHQAQKITLHETSHILRKVLSIK